MDWKAMRCIAQTIKSFRKASMGGHARQSKSYVWLIDSIQPIKILFRAERQPERWRFIRVF